MLHVLRVDASGDDGQDPGGNGQDTNVRKRPADGVHSSGWFCDVKLRTVRFLSVRLTYFHRTNSLQQGHGDGAHAGHGHVAVCLLRHDGHRCDKKGGG